MISRSTDVKGALRSRQRGFLLNPFRFVGADYNTTVLASAPVGFWPLDETSGTTAVDLVAGRNGTRTGGAIVAGVAPGSPAAFAPQTTGLITVAANAAFVLPTLSLELWLKTTTTSNLVIFECNGNSGFSMQSSAPGAPTTGGTVSGVHTNFGSSTYFTASSIAVNTGAAVHIVFRATTGSGTGSVVVNGVVRTLTGTSAAMALSGFPLMIGSRSGAFGLPTGSAIGKVAIYNRLLTDSECAAHYSAAR